MAELKNMVTDVARVVEKMVKETAAIMKLLKIDTMTMEEYSQVGSEKGLAGIEAGVEGKST
jgi:hypothetical protein